jgi:serine/alanine adding enzyme
MTVETLPLSSPWPVLSPHSLFPKLNAHGPEWLAAVTRGLTHKPTVLIRRTAAGQVDGILPLVQVKSLLFGRFLVSLPYVNTGGVWAESEEAARELITHACRLADSLNVRYLELRHEKAVEHPQLNACRTDKVHMRLPLPATVAALDASFKAKLRSQVKKSKSHELTIQWGTAFMMFLQSTCVTWELLFFPSDFSAKF